MKPFEKVFNNFSLPDQVSDVAPSVDSLYNFTLVISLVVFVAMMGTMCWFLYKYRRTAQNEKSQKSPTESHSLEFLWSVIPLVIFIAIAIWGWEIYHHQQNPPANSETIHVIGKQWSWEFTYDNGVKTANELYVPVNKPITLDLASIDVIHSFYVPSFRVKKDVVPGMKTSLWFNAVKEGDYRIYCAEMCGTAHSGMTGYVHVLSEANYRAWLVKAAKEASALSLVDKGKALFNIKGCTACHSLNGERGVGPSLKGVWGRTSKFTDGTSLKVDANYIRESLMAPNAKIVEGFVPAMPTFQGQLTEDEINQLIDYLKTI
jgi:cytochrome c oxidase subunit 2